MEIKNYLIPPDIEVQSYEPYQWGSSVQRHTTDGFPNLDDVKLALIGIGESRNSADNADCSDAPDHVREHFYKLAAIAGVTLADIGNLKPGQTPQDTYAAVEFVCSELLANNIIPIIVGGART